MYYHLSNHIYITQFRDELILLDAKKDQYTICFKQFSDLLRDVLKKNFSEGVLSLCDSFEFSSQELVHIENFLANNIIGAKNSPYPFYIDKKSTSEGVSNVDWRLPLENKKIPFNLQVLKALAALIRVNFYIRFKGLYKTIQLVKKSRSSDLEYIIPQDQDLRELANIVNTACLMYPTRTKCLEWAMTFVLLALKRKWKCNLEIGVQNYPFMAHAWVECNGKVVMDSQDLRDGLAIILNEPFRKLRI